MQSVNHAAGMRQSMRPVAPEVSANIQNTRGARLNRKALLTLSGPSQLRPEARFRIRWGATW
jgi:hypothetical protein